MSRPDRKAEILALGEKGLSSAQIARELGLSKAWAMQVLRKNAGLLPNSRQVAGGLPKPFGEDIVNAIREHITYDAESGQLFSRGVPVGCGSSGYVVVRIGGPKGRHLKAHRVAWFIYYGSEPSGQIDHIDGDGTNNRIANLRLSDARTNAFNRRRPASNRTGIKGVSHGYAGSYRVTCGAFGQTVSLTAQSLEEARKARQRLAEQLHGEFVRHD